MPKPYPCEARHCKDINKIYFGIGTVIRRINALCVISVRRKVRGTVCMKRREARELLLTLLYEAQFYKDADADEIYGTALRYRGIEDDGYVRRAFYTINEKLSDIDAVIAGHAKGWNAGRISKVTRSILRLCVYEMMFEKDIPVNVSLNEAVELAKKYDGGKSGGFVNGVLNAVSKELFSGENTGASPEASGETVCTGNESAAKNPAAE